MTTRASTVILGQIVVAARPDGLETAEAIGLADGRVLLAGSEVDVRDAAASDARLIDARGMAVIPGIHDFHMHLVGLSRARRSVPLADVASYAELVARVEDAAARLPADAWLFGRGWPEDRLDQGVLHLLEAAVGQRPAVLTSHDGHSAWASMQARRRAHLSAATPDPEGGRIERDIHGEPNGVLRERATGAVDEIAEQLSGTALADALREQVA
ncbi:MAG TPA: amidohydrolase family protein, partial [Candidatus Limnocylindria bacterium]|nr:amidohydrolase family protein [Candidatus Limnocylindria bacterium]